MIDEIYRGEKVRLVAVNPEKDAALIAGWQWNTEFARLLDSDPVRLWSAVQAREWLEKEQKANTFERMEFIMRTLDDDRAIGFIALDGISFYNGDSFVGVGIGNRDDWGKGYGSDAMHILARYAFDELGLHRLTLNVFAYNTRAIRVYEKIGYVVEGRIVESIHREGQRWDMIFMGLLREAWQKQRAQAVDS